MRKLASIVTIDKVTPIENSDRLSVATMRGKGWKVVVGREDFKEGDHAVYFEIDSFLPNEDRYGFLRERCLRRFMTKDGQTCLKEGLRIKTMKLRGVISQGLLIPMDKFPEIEARRQYEEDGTFIGVLLPCEMGDGTPIEKTMTFEGADVTNLLNVEHYDEVKAALVPEKGTSIGGDALGSFPSWIPKTDEERCLAGDTVVITDAGVLKLKDVVEKGLGREVLSYDIANDRAVMTPIVTRTRSDKSEGWLKITLDNGMIVKCTGDHKIYIPELGVFRVAEKLKVGDFVTVHTV